MTTVFFAVTKWMSVALMFPAQGSARAGVPGAGRVSRGGAAGGRGEETVWQLPGHDGHRNVHLPEILENKRVPEGAELLWN